MASRTLLALLLLGCSGGKKSDGPGIPTPDELIAKWETEAAPTWAAWQNAEWDAHTHVRENDTTWAEKASEARETWEQEIGKADWLSSARDVYQASVETRRPKDEKPDPAAIAKLEGERKAVDAIRLLARANNEASADLRRRRDHQWATQLRTRDQSLPKLDGAPVDPGELEGKYRASSDVVERARLWSGVLSGARELKSGYGALRDALNTTAKKVGSEDHYRVALLPYEIKPNDLDKQLVQLEEALRPLYRQLHTWARYELAARYNVTEVPTMLPAHWLDDPLASTWSATFRFVATDPARGLGNAGADGMLRNAEAWFTDSGLPGLPGEVWQTSSLYPVEASSRFQKTPGASTWDIDLGGDIRLLMSATPTEPWMHASNRELAFAHILVERDAVDWPTPLRAQPMTAVEAALATWADLSASRPQRLARLGLIDGSQLNDPTILLLEEALTWVPFTVFAAGTARAFEREVYEGRMPVDRITSRWWELALEHQGVVPPETRTERWADPLYVQQLTDAPGRYFEFALATMMAFQLHEKACADAGIDPRTGDPATAQSGALFTSIATGIAAKPWRELIEEATGEAPNPGAITRHFAPLVDWLQEQNAGRDIAMPRLDGM